MNLSEQLLNRIDELAPAQHGFDLTDMDVDDFRAFLGKFNLPANPVKFDTKAKYGFHWESKDLLLVTGNNPITGENMYKNRQAEVGFLSYVGLEGNPLVVKKAVEFIKRNGDYKDESVGTREFI